MFYVWIAIIGAIIGYLASLIVKGRGSGILFNIVIGIAGSFAGGWLAGKLGWSPVGAGGFLLVSVVGAIALLLAASLLSR